MCARAPATQTNRIAARVEAMLLIEDLTKRYGSVVALDGATFEARPGRLVGFLGPNGSGKTTTMRCIFGLVRPERGRTLWDGAPIDRLTRLRFGYMPEQRGLYPRMRVAEQLSYFAQHHGMSGRDADAATKRWLERLGLADRANSKLEELSHGNQQRVQLGAALVHDPELLILDEPFSGLDPIGIATMSEILRERAAAGVGVAVLEPPARSRRGHLRGRGHHRPRPDRRPGPDRSSSARRPNAATSTSRSKGAGSRWLDGRADLTIVEQKGDLVRLLVGADADLAALLAAATAAGPVRRFSFQPPALSELFMEVVQS